MNRQPHIHLPYEKNAKPFTTSVVGHNWQAMVMIKPAGHRNPIILMGDCHVLASELRSIADRLEGER